MNKGKTILERLYRGEIFPAEEIPPQSDEYRAIRNNREKLRDRLSSELPDDYDGLLDEYDVATEDVHRMDLQHTYAAGVRFGIQLMVEALCVDGEMKSRQR